MGLFTRSIPDDFHKLSTRLDEAENEILKLKTAQKLAKAEWDDLYDKITKQVERMRKRSQVPIDDAQEGTEKQKEIPEYPPQNFNRHMLLAEARRRGQG